MSATTAPLNLTPTQRKLFNAMRDGNWHTRSHLQVEILGRRFAADSFLPTHLMRLRHALGGGWSMAYASSRGWCLRPVEETADA